MVLMFFVKVPVFGLHLWLPKAHVEAPLVGSIVLSGSLLKIGFYGIIRFLKFNKLLFSKCSSYFICLGWVSALYVRIICLRQLDIKSIVAYSSVVHIGVAFSGLLRMTSVGLKSCVYECLAHGLRSPLMFYGVYMSYNFLSSRRLILSKGSSLSSPLHSYIMFIVVISSLGVPPFISFFSEFMSNVGVLFHSQVFFFLTILFLFASGVYLFYFFVYFFHGDSVMWGCKYVFRPDLNSVFFIVVFMLVSTFFFGFYFLGFF